MTDSPPEPSATDVSPQSGDQAPNDDLVYRIDVSIRAPVHDTEVPERVTDAVRTGFPTADVTVDDDAVVAETHDLDHLAERIHELAIVETARAQFFDDADARSFTFALDKQAAATGRINFAVDESELGDLSVEVTVHEPDPVTLIDALFPSTDTGD